MMATRNIASTGGKKITNTGIRIVEVPNPVMVPPIEAINVSKVMQNITINYS